MNGIRRTTIGSIFPPLQVGRCKGGNCRPIGTDRTSYLEELRATTPETHEQMSKMPPVKLQDMLASVGRMFQTVK